MVNGYGLKACVLAVWYTVFAGFVFAVHGSCMLVISLQDASSPEFSVAIRENADASFQFSQHGFFPRVCVQQIHDSWLFLSLQLSCSLFFFSRFLLSPSFSQ
jgi:hypothetical protein